MSNAEKTQAPTKQVEKTVETAKAIDPKILALAEILQAKKDKEAVKRRGAIAAKYPHAIAETLCFDPTHNKWKCRIRCLKTKDESRWVFTSDLWQVKYCEKVAKEMQAEARKQKNADVKEAMALLKSQRNG